MFIQLGEHGLPTVGWGEAKRFGLAKREGWTALPSGCIVHGARLRHNKATLSKSVALKGTWMRDVQEDASIV